MLATPLAAGIAMLALAGQQAEALPLSLSCLQQFGLTLSSQPISTCLATPSFTQLMPYFYSSNNNSIVAPLGTYLEAVCPAPLCTNGTIEGAISGLNSSCGSTISSIGLTNQTISTLIPKIPEIKKWACLETTNMTNSTSSNSTSMTSTPAYNGTSSGNSTNGTDFCLVDVLSTAQTVLNQNITFDLVWNLISGKQNLSSLLPTNVMNGTSNSTTPNNTLSNMVCTDCVKAYYTAATNGTTPSNSTVSSGNSTMSNLVNQLVVYIDSVCGDQFSNGTMPSTIMNGTNTMAPFATSSSSAASGIGALTSAMSSAMSASTTSSSMSASTTSSSSTSGVGALTSVMSTSTGGVVGSLTSVASAIATAV